MRDVKIIQDLLSANGVKPTGSSHGSADSDKVRH